MAAQRCILFFVAISVSVVYTNNICYQCYGIDESSGKSCNINSTCYGSGCMIEVFVNGSFVSGCSESLPTPEIVPINGHCANQDDGSVFCGCVHDLCNNPVKWKREIALVNRYVKLALPDGGGNIGCLECGSIVGADVGLGEGMLNVTCDGQRICTGTACLTVRSSAGHSFCASAWMGTYTEGCYHIDGQDEICVCTEDYCNIPMPKNYHGVLKKIKNEIQEEEVHTDSPYYYG